MILILRAPVDRLRASQVSSSAVHPQRQSRNLKLVIGVLICTALTSCGKVGAPVAPTRLNERTSDLSAIQRGSAVQLSWPAPRLETDESSRFYISRVQVYRAIEHRDEEPILDPDDYETAAKVVAVLDRQTIEDQVKTLGHLECPDSITLGSPKELANIRLRYAVRYFNSRGQKSAFSNTVAVDPAPGIALPPTDLAVHDAQDAITLTWNAPTSNIDGSAPAAVVGYNVYRHQSKRNTADEPLNHEPITTTTFTDVRFQYQTEYVYSVRSLSQGATGLVESADSAPLVFEPVDKFEPSPPDPVSIASANGTISLFWPTSSESDVIGYNVYRATSGDPAPAEWVKLNEQPVTPVTFRDDQVVMDKTYSYRVTAVDRFNNESKPSRVVSETVHP